MRFERFAQRARQIFAAIPAELRQGVDAIEVSRETLAHPEMAEVYTLGECVTGELDLGSGPDGAPRSVVHVYHGSFRALARLEDDFDWDAELHETILHEVRHHRESLAGEDALEDLDWAEDENFKRRAGKPFDPFFFRAGTPLESDGWEVDGDLFVLRELTRADQRRGWVSATVGGQRVRVTVPRELGDAHFVYLRGRWDEAGEVAVVLAPRRGFWRQVARLLAATPPRVSESELEVGPPPEG